MLSNQCDTARTSPCPLHFVRVRACPCMSGPCPPMSHGNTHVRIHLTKTAKKTTRGNPRETEGNRGKACGQPEGTRGNPRESQKSPKIAWTRMDTRGHAYPTHGRPQKGVDMMWTALNTRRHAKSGSGQQQRKHFPYSEPPFCIATFKCRASCCSSLQNQHSERPESHTRHPWRSSPSK